MRCKLQSWSDRDWTYRLIYVVRYVRKWECWVARQGSRQRGSFYGVINQPINKSKTLFVLDLDPHKHKHNKIILHALWKETVRRDVVNIMDDDWTTGSEHRSLLTPVDHTTQAVRPSTVVFGLQQLTTPHKPWDRRRSCLVYNSWPHHTSRETVDGRAWFTTVVAWCHNKHEAVLIFELILSFKPRYPHGNVS